MKVSIVTPVWNRADLTIAYLYQLWQLYAKRDDIEFVIIDNGSTDGTPATLEQWHSTMNGRLISIRNPENMGFGPANNQGVDSATGDIIILLNNDITILGDFVSIIEQQLEKRPEALLGAEYYDFDTGWNVFDGAIIPYLAGWCLACTKETWLRLDGFDERFVPCDYEDMDLSRTAMTEGVDLVQVGLPLQHTFEQTALQLEGGRRAITEKNRKLFIEKWGFFDG